DAGIEVFDRSFAHFSEQSEGYRFGWTWGEVNCPRLTVGTDLNYVTQNLTETMMFQATAPIAAFPQQGNPNIPTMFGNENLGLPPSHIVDPGIFAETTLPVTKRFTVKLGVRAAWADSASDPRMVTGSIPVGFSSTATGQGNFNPIALSSQPGNDTTSADF